MSTEINDGLTLIGRTSIPDKSQDLSFTVWQADPVPQELVRITTTLETIVTGDWDAVAARVLRCLRESAIDMQSRMSSDGIVLDSHGWQIGNEVIISIDPVGHVGLGPRFANHPFWQRVLMLSATTSNPA